MKTPKVNPSSDPGHQAGPRAVPASGGAIKAQDPVALVNQQRAANLKRVEGWVQELSEAVAAAFPFFDQKGFPITGTYVSTNDHYNQSPLNAGDQPDVKIIVSYSGEHFGFQEGMEAELKGIVEVHNTEDPGGRLDLAYWVSELEGFDDIQGRILHDATKCIYTPEDYFGAFVLLRDDMRGVLGKIRDGLVAEGATVNSDVEEWQEDECKLTLDMEVGGFRYGVAFILMDSCDHEGTHEGFTVDLKGVMVGDGGGYDLFRYSPYNYTSKVWTKDADELKSRTKGAYDYVREICMKILDDAKERKAQAW
jgi:hypothetical protein